MVPRFSFSILLTSFLLLSSCGPPTKHYVLVNRALQQQNFDEADRVIERYEKDYGGRNTVLYDLDRAVTLHMAGRYTESNRFLEKAEARIDALYTKSVTKETGAMFTNDSTLPYEGEDFEKVMINILSALNYALLSKWDDALVEARKVDHKLNVMNDKYKKKNLYKEDAFARYLSAILYERNAELNDAFIDYRKAYEVYEKYKKDYKTPMPPGIPGDLLRVTEALGLGEEHQFYRDKFPNTRWRSYKEFRNEGEVIFISLDGLSPIKEDYYIDVPIPDGKGDLYLLRVALPRFKSQPTNLAYAEVHLMGEEKVVVSQRTFLVEDVTAISKKNLEDRITRISVKAIARATAKYAASRTLEREASKAGGDLAGEVVGLLTNVYSVASEQADKRSWQTLPGKIRMSRLTVPPGTYTFSVEYYSHDHQLLHRNQFDLTLKKGEKRFITSRMIGTPQRVR